ncbi:uncharacterized protein LOC109832527 [Asparagus officinalis]|uniref:uncharacterized protein LOC109832527 n=1 Tax=Asparagus officinalis TaxID=4686 RepID=UPI00098E0488|nr:uncharacterized protein LOC109832527 [Asparagus officinalis]
MAHRGFLATAFLCLLLCLSFQGNAIDVSKYEGKMEYQHTSIAYAESLALANTYFANKYFATDSNDNVTVAASTRVYPELYEDHDTHFFVLWRSGQQKKECYNLKCEGFKWDDASPFVPWYKNLDTGDWWLYYGPNGDQPVGYWPKSLFTTLADKASQIYIGGEVTFKRGGPSPPMGSGHYAVEGYKKQHM